MEKSVRTPTNKLLRFFLAVSKLKEVERSGWVWRGLKRPETIAEHSFRTAFLAWALGEKAGIDTGRAIQIALVHDICEVYAGDLTPYHGLLPSNRKKKDEMLSRWVRVPRKQKEKLTRTRQKLEERALRRLIKNLAPSTQREIYALWADFEYGRSREGKFVNQLDRVEALLQAIEYFGTGPDTAVVSWWEEVEELADEPTIRGFLKDIEGHFYEGKRVRSAGLIKLAQHLSRLKGTTHPKWEVGRHKKIRDSVATHSFLLALMVFVLAKEQRMPLRTERILKMALVHDASFAFMESKTRYDVALRKTKSQKERKHVFERWVRYSMKEKQEMFRQNYQAEKRGMRKLVSGLSPTLKREMASAWEEWKQNSTRDSHFVQQAHTLESLFQALLNKRADAKFPIEAWWEGAFEYSDSEINFEFMEAAKRLFRRP